MRKRKLNENFIDTTGTCKKSLENYPFAGHVQEVITVIPARVNYPFSTCNVRSPALVAKV